MTTPFGGWRVADFEEEDVYLPWALGVQGVLAGWVSHHPPKEITAEAEGIPHGHVGHTFVWSSWPLPVLELSGSGTSDKHSPYLIL